jgi:hypothetical protein
MYYKQSRRLAKWFGNYLITNQFGRLFPVNFKSKLCNYNFLAPVLVCVVKIWFACGRRVWILAQRDSNGYYLIDIGNLDNVDNASS